MVKEILDVTSLPYRETRFLKPPDTSYVVYMDEVERRGGDGINLISQHDVTFELYEYKPDPNAERLIETTLDALGIQYTKQPRVWIQSEQLYQVVYDFTYYQKGGL